MYATTLFHLAFIKPWILTKTLWKSKGSVKIWKRIPQKYAEYLEKERLWQQKIRKEKKQFLKKHPMKAKEEREKKKLKQKELRRKKKEENGTLEVTTPKQKASTERERRQRDRERKMKAKEEIAKKKRAVLKTQIWRMRINLQGEKSDNRDNMDGDAFPSSTEKRTVRKVKRSLPKTPSKRAKIVETLTKSPSTKALLERKGAILSEKSRRTLDMGGALLDAMSRSFQSLKVKWGTLMRNEYAAYSGLRSVIHDVKNKKIRQEMYRLFQLRRPQSARTVNNSHKWIVTCKKRKDRISERVKSKVKEFYLSAWISKENPNMKAALQIKKKKTVTIIPHHNMLMSLEDAYNVFVKTYPNMKIGFTMFRKLHPVQVSWLVKPIDVAVCVKNAAM